MSDTQPITAPLCTFDPECGQTAIASYTWPWGETGLCCARHQVILGQRATQLKRAIQLTPLQPGAERPVTRDERIQAAATKMALEAELDEARTRGMELYRSVEALQAQLKTALAQKAELQAQLQRELSNTEQLLEENGKLRSQAAQENAELQQLRALVPQTPPSEPQKIDGLTTP